ncbi:unnamed protein product, partial [Closterium sp. Naga37s-1]
VTDTLILNPSGQLVGVIGVSADISDIKRKEGEIRALNAALEEHIVERTEQLQRNNRCCGEKWRRSCLRGAHAAMHQGLGAIEQPHMTAVVGAGADGGGAARCALGGGVRQPPQVTVPGVHEPREPYSHEQRARSSTASWRSDTRQLTRAAGHLDLSKNEAGELEIGTANPASLRASRTASSCSRCPPYLECRWRLCPAQCARSPSTASSPSPANLASSGYCSRMCHGLGWHGWRGVAWDVMCAHVVACGGMMGHGT